MSRTDKAPTPAPAAAPAAGAPAPATQAPLRIPRPAGGPGRGGPFAGMNIPAEKAMNFGPSARRLLGELRPERLWLVLVLLLAVVGVTFSVIGPRLLGEGTNLIFAGVVAKQLPAGETQAQVIAQMRAAGQTQQADMLSAMTLTPGTGIDFTALATVLLWALVLYVLASVFGWMQAYILNGVVQRTVFRLRERIEAKINRAAAALLRLRAARRAAQPGDQRRRQHLPKPAAVHQPGRDLGADRGRGAGDDGPALAHAGADCAGDHSADPGDDGGDRQALPEAVRGCSGGTPAS